MMAAAEKEVVFHAVDGRAEELVLEHGPVHGDVFVVLDVVGGGGDCRVVVIVVVSVVVARLVGRRLVAAVDVPRSTAGWRSVLVLNYIKRSSAIRHLGSALL